MTTLVPDANREVPFPLEEIFFSRTDTRGIILSGNSVFQRISLYTWEELYKKPHNIIRHPDMPKGVFYLLWDFLKRGLPIGAYVKNRAKDGRYYWVFAIVTPVEGGYLSVRLKPSSPVFPAAQEAYATLLAKEQQQKITPQESMSVLLEMLKTLGFDSYEQFMSVALCAEMSARDAGLARTNDCAIAFFAELTSMAQSLINEARLVFASYEENKYVPFNLQIQSYQLGDVGRTVGVISGNYSVVSAEIKDELAKFSASANELFNTIYEAQFLACIARIQREVVAFFEQEEMDLTGHKHQEMELLQTQSAAYQDKIQRGLITVSSKIATFQEDCQRMKLCAASLEIIRVMGKIDIARLPNVSHSLQGLMEDLQTFQETITSGLRKINAINSNMAANMATARSLLQAS